MTRTEAIEILKAYPLVIKDQQAIQEAIEFAISSLETDEAYQLEYEEVGHYGKVKPRTLVECKAEDCRSLKDIKQLLARKAEALDGVPLKDGGGACIGIYMSIAEDLPSVYPKSDKPIRSHWHGHWIDCDKSDDYSADGYDCSVCGVNAEYATSYCPNCGAKMVEPQESEDT